MTRPLGVRWTIGDVSVRGFEALRLSIWGATKILGPDTQYMVCVNTVPVDVVTKRIGAVPEQVVFRDVTDEVPVFLRPYLDPGMAEGVAWRLSPLQVFPERCELALDNDCILWGLPDPLRAWRDAGDGCLLAEDVRACFGQFASFCGHSPRNTGIRGLRPGFDLDGALRRALARLPVRLVSELDEHGLQVAALTEQTRYVVRASDVTICSPFPPHVPDLGHCGAHFVGLNAKRFSWTLHDRPAHQYDAAHWEASGCPLRAGRPAHVSAPSTCVRGANARQNRNW